jgi:tRNA A37 threonylcarbamoyladenosine modification protein TsaB
VSAPDAARRGPLLALDTSTLTAGIALYGAGGLLGETSWSAGRAQTTAILGETARLLELAALRPVDLGAVAVATGPGAFNGLRVGLSTAKGLCFALGLPLLGIPTLDAVAYPHGGYGHPVRAVIAAGRGRFVSALYDWPGGELASPDRVREYDAGRLGGAGRRPDPGLRRVATGPLRRLARAGPRGAADLPDPERAPRRVPGRVGLGTLPSRRLG